MRIAIAALPLALSAAALAESADRRVWTTSVSAAGAFLGYGVPQSDDVVISFECGRGSGRVTVFASIGSVGLKDGGPAALTLSSGTERLTLSGKAVFSEMTGVEEVQAETRLDQRLVALFRAGPSLLVQTQGAREAVPLNGAPAALDRFLAACRRR